MGEKRIEEINADVATILAALEDDAQAEGPNAATMKAVARLVLGVLTDLHTLASSVEKLSKCVDQAANGQALFRTYP